MDSLKSLMDKQQYELVVKLTVNSDDCTSLFYRISALLVLGKGEEALECIKTHRNILETQMNLLIKIHIEILCILTRYDEAFEVLDYYKNKPYESQEVEELLKDMPKYIRLEEKKASSFRGMDDEVLNNKLKSKDADTILMAIDIVKERDIVKFIDNIKKLLLNFPKQSIRSLVLLLLVQKKYDCVVRFNHLGDIIDVNPSLLEPPFVGTFFNSIIKEVDSSFKNPALRENAIQILSTHLLYIYPNRLDIGINVIIEALYQISNQYLNNNVIETLEDRCEKKQLDINQVKSLINDVNDSLNNF